MSDTITRDPTALSGALERVMRQVLAMKRAGDIDHLIREVWEVLVELDFDFLSCALLLMDEQRDWLTSYNVWEQDVIAGFYDAPDAQRHARVLDDGLVLFAGQTALSQAPDLYRDAIAAWRQGTVERHRLEVAEIKQITRLNAHRYGSHTTPDNYPIRFHLHIPFAHGVFTLRTGRTEIDQFAAGQMVFLKQLVEILSAGYVRYREFLDLERDRTAQRLRAEVQAMHQGDDIIDLMGRLWEELQWGGIYLHYMSIAVADEEEDGVHLYAVWHYDKLRGIVDKIYPLLRKDIAAHADLYYTRVDRRVWEQYRTDIEGIYRVEKEEVAAYMERLDHLWQFDNVDEAINPAFHAAVFMAAALPQGRILAAQLQTLPEDAPVSFAPEELEVLETFAEALGLGFTRFFDFQRLERHNRNLQVERALERVRAEVLHMEQSADIGRIVRVIWEELIGLGYDFPRCSISIIEEERDFYGIYVAGQLESWIKVLPEARNIEMFGERHYATHMEQTLSGEGSFFRPQILAAWRRGEVFSEFRPGVHNREALAAYYRRFYGIEIDTAKMPDVFFACIPFTHGVFGVTSEDLDPEQFDADDMDLFRRFGEAFGEGYARFLELRQREIQRDVEQLRAEVASMRHSEDIADMAVLLSQQLRELGLEFNSCSFSVIDEEAGLVRLYAAGPREWVRAPVGDRVYTTTTSDRSSIGKLEDFRGPVVIYDIVPDFDFAYTVEDLEGSPILEERGLPPRFMHRTEEDARQILERYRQRWGPDYPLDRVPRSVIRMPFSHGSIAVISMEADQYTQRDVDLVAAFADAVSLGFTRFHDFQRLEQRNRELEIERAVERVQNEVQAMKTSADILPVIPLLSGELGRLGLDYTWCSISIVDREAERVRVYGTLGPSWSESKFRVASAFGQPDFVFGRDSMERLENEEGTFCITGIPGETQFANYMNAPLDSYHGRLQDIEATAITSRTEEEAREIAQEYIRRWNVDDRPEELMLRSVLRTPFAGGTIALTHIRPDHYSERDARILERFAEAFSLGYARHLDFRHLEQRNRELEIEWAVEQVQNAVQAMKTSADIMPVMSLLYEEMQRLGMDYSYFSVSIVDQAAEKVRVYVTSSGPHMRVLFPPKKYHLELETLGPQIIERLESEEGPLFITGLAAGQEDLQVHCMSGPLDSYHGRLQQIGKATIVSRSDEEMRQIVADIQKFWKVEDWPEEASPRSVLRVPFTGGTIALSDSRPDFFSEREARILERFAEAFSLGYVRYLDIRQLEEQNRALAAASRVKSEFLANMSHELRTPMNAIINFSSMVLDGVCGEISDDVRDVVGEIDQNGGRLLELINDVLDLSKIEAGAMQLQRAPCDPGACVENVVAALEHLATKKGLEISSQVKEDLPVIVVDEPRLTRHVLVNLVNNAIKFTRAGEIEVGVKRDNGQVLFWVRDTGIGIPAAEQERIFETFHQVDGSITRQAEGTGLGLTIAHKFVELHRGKIWVESEEDQGSTFYFTVPAET